MRTLGPGGKKCVGPGEENGRRLAASVALGEAATLCRVFAPLTTKAGLETVPVWPPQGHAHAGSRTRVTSMGGLYDAATLRALVPGVRTYDRRIHASIELWVCQDAASTRQIANSYQVRLASLYYA